MKVIEKYFPVVRFIMPSRVVLTFGSVDEILKCKVISLLELKLLRAMCSFPVTRGQFVIKSKGGGNNLWRHEFSAF